MPPVKAVKQDTDVVVPRAGETYVSDDGTVSQVLDDHIDATYEPTEEEVLEFADWIGMKLPEDKDLLWLAREGLKTALPKEWKPCSTNDGEIYYFNFKTGESSWDHPLDGMFRQRFEQEKAKGTRKGSATAAVKTATASPTPAKASTPTPVSGAANPRAVIPPTRVIMTDMGVVTRSPITEAATVRPVTSARRGREKSTTESIPIATAARGEERKGSVVSVDALYASAAPQGRTNQLATNAGTTSTAVAVATERRSTTSSAASAPPPPHRIVSEAERAMEERVRRDVQAAIEAEKTRLADTHTATMRSLEELHENDVAEMRATAVARRAASTKEADEERERRLRQTRERCEETHGDDLRALERESATLTSKLQKLEAEAVRAASGNTQRTQLESDMAAALARQRSEMEASSKKQHAAAMEAAWAAHTIVVQKIATEAEDKMAAVNQVAQRKVDNEERAMALRADGEKKRLEDELKSLESQIADVARRTAVRHPSNTSNSATTNTPAIPSLTSELSRIAAGKAARLQKVEADGSKALAEAQARGEAALADVPNSSPQLLSAPTTKGLSPGSTGNRSFLMDRPMPVSVGGGGVNSPRLSTPGGMGVAYTQELNRIRMVQAKERQERLARLRVDREAAFAGVSVSPLHSLKNVATHSPASFPGSSAAAMRASMSMEDLKAAHTVELEAKRALFQDMEAQLTAQLERESAAAVTGASSPEQQRVLVEEAVEAEMQLYAREVETRYARMQEEADMNREKQRADHQLALDAYELKKVELEQRRVREEQEAKEAFIQEKVDAAVTAEIARLAAEQKSVMARRSSRYEEEREAMKAEVDEEMAAYETGERAKITKTFAVTSAVQQPAWAQQEVTELTRQVAALTEQHANRLKAYEGDQLKRRTAQKALESTRDALLQQQRQLQENLSAANAENTRVATAAPTHTQPAHGSSDVRVTDSAMRWRLRSAHADTVAALEAGYRAQQQSLEVDLQSWRDRSQSVRLEKEKLSQSAATAPPAVAGSSSTLNTPSQQLLTHVDQSAAAMAAQYSRFPCAGQPSPIAITAAGASLQNTPMWTSAFVDSPWRQQQQWPVAGTYPSFPASGLPLYGGASGPTPTSLATPTTTTAPRPAVSALPCPSTREAMYYWQEHQHALQQRQASLQAAREAWQQQRLRNAQQQQQQQQIQYSGYPATMMQSMQASSFQGMAWEEVEMEMEEERQRRVRSIHACRHTPSKDQLSIVLTKLSHQLDTITDEAESYRRNHSRSPHRLDTMDVSKCEKRKMSSKGTGASQKAKRLQSPPSPSHRHPHEEDTSRTEKPARAPRSVLKSSSPEPRQSRSSHRAHADDDVTSKWESLLKK